MRESRERDRETERESILDNYEIWERGEREKEKGGRERGEIEIDS